MSDLVSTLLQWLNANPEWALFATFIISAAESVAIIGTIVPGSVTMTAIGTLAGAGIIPLWATIFWAMLGAIVGDSISYFIGHHFKARLHQLWPFKNNPGILERGERFVHKYGVMSVFIGRFVGPVRALVPLVAGMFGMKPRQFAIANIASAIGWAPAYMLPGILLGAGSLELPPDIALHVILVLFLIILFIVLCIWSIYKILQLIHQQTFQIQTWMWQHLKRSPLLAPATILLKHHQPDKPNGQLNLCLYFLLTSTLLICLALYVKYTGAANLVINDALFHLFRGIRQPAADNIMLNLSLLGQKQVILPVVVILFGWLLLCKRWRLAVHVISLGILAAGSVFVMKQLIQSPRPWGIAFSPETFSMPSGHTTLATTLYFGFGFLLASSCRPSRRWPIYLLTSLLVFAIALSRLYLNAHWFTDVLSAWLLSASLLIFICIAYQRHAEKPINPISLFLVCFLGLTATFSFYHHQYFKQLTANYAPIHLPTTALSPDVWWKNNHSLPAYRTSLFGFPSNRINLEWVGELEKIRKTLVAAGWTKPPVRNWVSTLHRIADISSTQYLPLISPQYLDKKPALILTRSASDGKYLFVIRLWDSNCVMKDAGTPLWVGIISLVPRSYSWLTKKHTGEIVVHQDFIFPDQKALQRWETKLVTLKKMTSKNRLIEQKIILIKQK